jgi:hypothetical protein
LIRFFQGLSCPGLDPSHLSKKKFSVYFSSWINNKKTAKNE